MDYCLPKLVFEWDRFLVTYCNGKEREITLPDCVPVTWPMYQKIATLIRGSAEVDPADIMLVCQYTKDAGFHIIRPAEPYSTPSVPRNGRFTDDMRSVSSFPDVMGHNTSPLLGN